MRGRLGGEFFCVLLSLLLICFLLNFVFSINLFSATDKSAFASNSSAISNDSFSGAAVVEGSDGATD
jgi:hypothetical protein